MIFHVSVGKSASWNDLAHVSSAAERADGPVERLIGRGLVGGIVVGREVRMRERFRGVDPLARVEDLGLSAGPSWVRGTRTWTNQRVAKTSAERTSIFSSKSIASGSALRNFCEKGTRSRLGSDWTKRSVCGRQPSSLKVERTFSLQIVPARCQLASELCCDAPMTSSGGVPSSSVMIENWLTWSLPGKSGLPSSISAKMQPVDQMSTATSYLRRQRRRPRIESHFCHVNMILRSVRAARDTPDALGRPVISRRDVAGHLRVLQSREPKVAELQIAVLVDQDVGRFLRA